MKIHYRDSSIVVVEKPSGLLSVPGKGPKGADSVVSRIRKIFPKSIENPEVHRLDMDTSGLMLLALTKKSHRHLSIQFQERRIFKRYIALLAGFLEANNGRIELPFRLDYARRPMQVYDEEFGKIGVTEWKKIAIEENLTRIEFTPITGRTHQLRVHSAHQKGLGIPIVGDTLYGGHPKHGELKLHASELKLMHPETEQIMHFIKQPKF